MQAVPLVAAAALGHLLFGDFKLDLTTSLLVGCIPGVYLGAHLSAIAPGGLVRRALLFAPILWMVVRRRLGYPALSRWKQHERAMREAGLSRESKGGQA